MPYLMSDNVHWALLYLCSGTVGVVCILLMYSLLQYRKKKTIHFHAQLGREVIWTMIPFLILVALAIPAIVTFVCHHA